MRLGYLTMPMHPLERSPTDTLGEDREAIILADALRIPEVPARLISVGAEAAHSNPAAFGAFLQKETPRRGKVLHDANIRPPG